MSCTGILQMLTIHTAVHCLFEEKYDEIFFIPIYDGIFLMILNKNDTNKITHPDSDVVY